MEHRPRQRNMSTTSPTTRSTMHLIFCALCTWSNNGRSRQGLGWRLWTWWRWRGNRRQCFGQRSCGCSSQLGVCNKFGCLGNCNHATSRRTEWSHGCECGICVDAGVPVENLFIGQGGPPCNKCLRHFHDECYGADSCRSTFTCDPCAPPLPKVGSEVA